MSNISNQIKFIADKVGVLVKKNQSLTNDFTTLKTELDSWKTKANQANNKISQLENQIETLKAENEKLKTVDVQPAPTVTQSAGLSDKDINKMIKEIDECLALLDI